MLSLSLEESELTTLKVKLGRGWERYFQIQRGIIACLLDSTELYWHCHFGIASDHYAVA